MPDANVNDAQLDRFPEKDARARQLETLTMLGYSPPFLMDGGIGGLGIGGSEATSCLRCGAMIRLTRADPGQPAHVFPLQIHETWHRALGVTVTRTLVGPRGPGE